MIATLNEMQRYILGLSKEMLCFIHAMLSDYNTENMLVLQNRGKCTSMLLQYEGKNDTCFT